MLSLTTKPRKPVTKASRRISSRRLTLENLEHRSLLAADLSAGLVGHWGFNEHSEDGVNRAVDATGNNPGTIYNNTARVPGAFDTSLYFNGDNDHVNLGVGYELPVSGEISISAWIKPAFTHAMHNIVAHGYSQNPDGEVFFRINGGEYQIGSWNGVDHKASAPVPSEDTNNWVHLAGVYDDGYWRLYRNGVEIAATADPVGAVDTAPSTPWVIGARGGGGNDANLGRYFGGNIDELRIYNRGLSAEEVGLLANLAEHRPVASDVLYLADEELEIGTIIGQVSVTDPDVGDTHTFAFTSGNELGGLAISASGQVTVVDPLLIDLITVKSRQYAVEVTDSNGLTTTSKVGIALPGAFTVSGDNDASQGLEYVLQLDNDGLTHATWIINWGDGTIEEIAGDAQFATHAYGSTGDRTIAVAVGVTGQAPYNVSTTDIPVVLTSDVNLLINGSFEEYVVQHTDGWDIYGSIPGWSLTSGPAIELHRNILGGAAEGYQHLELDADMNGHMGPNQLDEEGSSGIQQTISVIPGITYTVSFQFRARPDTSSSDNSLEMVVANGENALVTANLTTDSTTWETYTYTFTPDDDTVTLSFRDTGVNNTFGTLIDDVRLYYHNYEDDNLPPVASDDIVLVTTTVQEILLAELLANDTDPENDSLAFVSFTTQPEYGQLLPDGSGGWYYQPNTGFIGTDSFQYEITDGYSNDIATVQLFVNATEPAGWLVAYTPVNPIFKSQPVKDGETVYIRRNHDDDDGTPESPDGPDDREDDRNIEGEDDLLKMEIKLDRKISLLQALGYTVSLHRSNSAIQLWTSPNKAEPLFVEGDVYTFPNPTAPDLATFNAYAEWRGLTGPEEATLQLIYTDEEASVVKDELTFKPFSSVVIGYVGEFQKPGDPNGMTQIMEQLYKSGYDAFIYDEDDLVYDRDFFGDALEKAFDFEIDPKPTPQSSYFEVENAILHRGVKNVAILGYSHGGGATYLLSKKLEAELPLNSFELTFTAYIDGVKKLSALAMDLPPAGTLFHYNVYQSARDIVPRMNLIQGQSIVDESVFFNDNTDDSAGEFSFTPELTHATGWRVVKNEFGVPVLKKILGIAEQPDVQNHLIANFFERFGEKK